MDLLRECKNENASESRQLRLFEWNFEIRGDAVAADESFRARDFWHSKEALSD